MTCSGTDNDGYPAPVNTPVTINVQSGASVCGSGVNVSGTGNSFINNDGFINGGPSSVVFNGVAGFSKTLTNNGTLNTGIVGTGNGIIVINQNGVINSGGITITGAGQNTLNIFAGKTVNGLANITGARNFVDSHHRDRLVALYIHNELAVHAPGAEGAVRGGRAVLPSFPGQARAA